MQMDLIRLQLQSLLVAHLPDALAAVDAARGGYDLLQPDLTWTEEAITTPAPQSYVAYPVLDESQVVWPVAVLLPRRAPLVDPERTGIAVRDYQLDLELWYADPDQQVLAIALERAAAAATLVVQERANWLPLTVDDTRVVDALFSEVAQDENGFYRACRLSLTVQAIEAESETP